MALEIGLTPILAMLAVPRPDAADWPLRLQALVVSLPAALVLATVVRWRTAAALAVMGALLMKGGTLGLELGMRLFPRDNLIGDSAWSSDQSSYSAYSCWQSGSWQSG